MKKMLLTLVMLIATFAMLPAQDSTTQKSPETSTTESPKSEVSCGDFLLTLQSESELLGLDMGFDMNKYALLNMDMEFGVGDYEWFSLRFGYGLKKRYIDDSFIFSAKLYPYVAFNLYDEFSYNMETGNMIEKSTEEISYGAAASIEGGFKIYKTKKSKETLYLTIGYKISAPEFETKGMFDYGTLCFGLSIAI